MPLPADFMKTPTHLLNLLGAPVRTPLEGGGRAKASVTLDLPPGLYRVGAEVDGSRFDWERLYVKMERYGNKGQRTGPWDFDFPDAKPLVPAWWVTINGHRRGLWVLARPSVEQLHARRFSGHFGFEVSGTGPTQIELEAYAEFDLDFLSFDLDREAADRPVPVKLAHSPDEAGLAAFQAKHRLWEQWEARLKGDARDYAPAVERAIVWAKAHEACPETLPLLSYAWKARGDREARDAALRTVKAFLDRPHWGNPAPDSYAHNIDMQAAGIIEPLSVVYHWLADDLGALRPALLERLRRQMDFFYHAVLLWADYWGGSLAQDHGRRSIPRLGIAALNLLAEIPEARHWVEFVIQRTDRAMRALPADGGIPFSSYHKVHLYMDDVVAWRDALLHATGCDLFERDLFPKIIGFVVSRLHEPTRMVLCASARGDRKDFYGGWGFFNAIAAKHRDPRAAHLAALMVRQYATRAIDMRPAATVLHAVMHHDPSVKSTKALDAPPFVHLPDSGLVHYRDDARDAAVSIRCIPPTGSGCDPALICPCDQAVDAPLGGHFTVAVGNQTLIQTAEGGYRMRASHGNVLLVDGKGGYGDEDYAMGIPGFRHRGERIEVAWFDAARGEGFVRMDLARAYPEAMGLVTYQREIFLRPGGMTCRDRVVSAKPHAFSWHFQTYARRSVTDLGENRWKTAEGASALLLTGQAFGCPLSSSVGPTEVVWSYGNENEDQPFVHVAFATPPDVRSFTANFDLQFGTVPAVDGVGDPVSGLGH